MDDLISRQSAIDNLKRHLNETDVPDSYPGIFNAIEEWLSDWEVPSAKPDSKESSLTQKALDSISREDAIDAIKTSRYLVDAMEKIIRLPSAQPEQRWIPCSERLPEPRIDVWCNSDMGQMVGYYEENVETWYGRDYLELMVTAWMPFPEPYKEDADE